VSADTTFSPTRAEVLGLRIVFAFLPDRFHRNHLSFLSSVVCFLFHSFKGFFFLRMNSLPPSAIRKRSSHSARDTRFPTGWGFAVISPLRFARLFFRPVFIGSLPFFRPLSFPVSFDRPPPAVPPETWSVESILKMIGFLELPSVFLQRFLVGEGAFQPPPSGMVIHHPLLRNRNCPPLKNTFGVLCCADFLNFFHILRLFPFPHGSLFGDDQ